MNKKSDLENSRVSATEIKNQKIPYQA